MRVILYLIDGLSGQKIPSINSKIVNDFYSNKLTYIDELIREGHSLSRCYGYDNTQSSLYALFTGKDIVNSQVTSTRYADLLLDYGETLAEKFVKAGWSTTYFSSNYSINKGIIYRGFEKLYHHFEQYDFQDGYKKFPEFELRVAQDKSFIFLHDFYTHDQNGKYSKGKTTYTEEEYQNLISGNGELLKRNLETIKFDKENDILLLFSDHGMTTGTELFDPANPNKEKLWSYNSKEFKAKILCSFIGKGIDAQLDERLFSLCDIHQTLLHLASIGESKETVFNSAFSQTHLCLANFGNGTTVAVDRKQFRQFVCIEKNQKFIFQDNINRPAEKYDMVNDPLEKDNINVDFANLPIYFQNYIQSYQQSRTKYSLKVILAFLNSYLNFSSIKHYFRNPEKVIRFLKKRILGH